MSNRLPMRVIRSINWTTIRLITGAILLAVNSLWKYFSLKSGRTPMRQKNAGKERQISFANSRLSQELHLTFPPLYVTTIPDTVVVVTGFCGHLHQPHSRSTNTQRIPFQGGVLTVGVWWLENLDRWPSSLDCFLSKIGGWVRNFDLAVRVSERLRPDSVFI